MIGSDAKFLLVKRRHDMRVILAAELSRRGADKRSIAAMDQMVELGAADVYVQDDAAERIMLMLVAEPDACFLVTDDGIVKMPVGRTQ
jgi:DhnA family fructose-bisphosphate aldolase class Ia